MRPTSEHPSSLVVHVVWTTWSRVALFTPDDDEPLLTLLTRAADACGCVLLALGVAEDHVHALVLHPPTLAVAYLAQRLKSGSARGWNVENADRDERRIAWGVGYWASSCDPRALEGIVEVLRDHWAHHRAARLREAWELAYREVGRDVGREVG